MRPLKCTLLAFMLSAIFLQSAMGSESAKERTSNILIKATKLALKIQPIPYYDSGTLAILWSSQGADARPWIEVLFEAIQEGAANAPSADEYRQAANTARNVLVTIRNLSSERASELAKGFPQPNPSLGEGREKEYASFRALIDQDVQDYNMQRDLMKLADSEFAHFNARSWINPISQMHFQGRSVEARLAFDRAVNVFRKYQNEAFDALQFQQFMLWTASLLPDSTASAFKLYWDSFKRYGSNMPGAYTLIVANTSVPMSSNQAYAIVILLVIASSHDGGRPLAEKLLESVPELNEKVQAAGGLENARTKGRIQSANSGELMLWQGSAGDAALFDRLKDIAKSNPAVARAQLVEAFGNGKDFQRLISAARDNEQSYPAVASIAWSVAQELVRNRKSTEERARMAEELISRYAWTHQPMQPSWIEFGLAILKEVGDRSSLSSNRNSLEDVLVGQWAISDFASAISYVDAINSDSVRLHLLVKIAEAYAPLMLKSTPH